MPRTTPPSLPPADDDTLLERQLRDSRTLEDAPEHVIQRTLQALQSLQQQRRRTQAASPAGLRQRLLAAISFDSAAATGLAFGVRSASAAPRQIVCSVGSVDIDLRVEPVDAGLLQLRGQVFGIDGACTVVLQRDGAALAEAALDAQGQFLLPAVPHGPATLLLRSDETEITLPALDLGAGP
jgi:hypothetical protein